MLIFKDVCVCVHECSTQGQKMASDPPGHLSDPPGHKFWTLVSCLTWVLETRLRLGKQCLLSIAGPLCSPRDASFKSCSLF